METKKLLLVEDDKGIAMGLEYSLRQEGFETVVCTAVCPALERLQTERFDLAILDLSLPDGTGYDVCRAIKAKNDGAAVIFLTARDDEGNIVMGLDMGADDYITKPFVPVEVLARVRSQLRRYAQLGSRPEEGSGSITIGGIVLDDRTKTVTVEGEPVSLTPTEYAILHLLMANPGKVFSTKVLYESVWQEAALGSEGAVAVHIRHLREKIEINPSEPRYLKVVWGQGYKMEGGK